MNQIPKHVQTVEISQLNKCPPVNVLYQIITQVRALQTSQAIERHRVDNFNLVIVEL